MKKRFFAVLIAVIGILLVFGAASPAKITETPVVAAENPDTSPLSARFLNMLNHNYVYDEDFGDFDKIALGSVLSMLPSREGDYVNEAYVKGFAKDMYGINIVSFNEKDWVPHKDGYVYILPMGITKFEHKNPTLTANEDGTYTVLTDITVDPHDAAPYTAAAVSLFAPNKDSAFGYVLIRSDIMENSAAF